MAWEPTAARECWESNQTRSSTATLKTTRSPPTTSSTGCVFCTNYILISTEGIFLLHLQGVSHKAKLFLFKGKPPSGRYALRLIAPRGQLEPFNVLNRTQHRADDMYYKIRINVSVPPLGWLVHSYTAVKAGPWSNHHLTVKLFM